MPNPKLLLQQLQVCGRHYNCQLSTTLSLLYSLPKSIDNYHKEDSISLDVLEFPRYAAKILHCVNSAFTFTNFTPPLPLPTTFRIYRHYSGLYIPFNLESSCEHSRTRPHAARSTYISTVISVTRNTGYCSART